MGNNMDNFLGTAGGSMSGFISGGGSAKGNVFSGNRIIPHNKGGVFDQMMAFPMGGRRVGTAFESAPEAVMPLARDRSGNLGVKVANSESSNKSNESEKVVINIINNSGSQVTTKESNSGGMREIEVLIEGMITKSLDRGQGAKVLNTTYGLKRQGVVRG